MHRRGLSVVLLSALAFSPLFVANSASAARAPISVKASSSTVKANSVVVLKGKVKVSKPRIVKVQERKNGVWKQVKRAKVKKSNKTYSVKVRVGAGSHAYRIKLVKPKRNAISRTITIRGTATTTPPAPTSQLAKARATILKDTNNFRGRNGLAPLKAKSSLDTVAQNWTVRMAKTGEFEHNPNFSKQYPNGWSRAGENIAYGYSLNQVVQGWIDSPGHRANILGSYTHIGIGYAVDGNGRPYYTQNFARY